MLLKCLPLFCVPAVWVWSLQSPADDPFMRPPSGGPVKRNDAAYRWVTDETKYEMTEVVEDKMEEQVSTILQSPSPLTSQGWI